MFHQKETYKPIESFEFKINKEDYEIVNKTLQNYSLEETNKHLFGIYFDYVLPQLKEELQIEFKSGSSLTVANYFISENDKKHLLFWDKIKYNDLYRDRSLEFFTTIKKITTISGSFITLDSNFLKPCDINEGNDDVFSPLFTLYNYLSENFLIQNMKGLDILINMSMTSVLSLKSFRNLRLGNKNNDLYDVYLFNSDIYKYDFYGNKCNNKYHFIKRLKKKPFNIYTTTEINICKSLSEIVSRCNIQGKYNYIYSSVFFFVFEKREYTEWRNMDCYLGVITKLDDILEKNGIFIYYNTYINHELNLQLFTMLTKCFKEVRFIKNGNDYMQIVYVVCIGFIKIIPEIYLIHNEWVKKHNSCGLEIIDDVYVSIIKNDLSQQINIAKQVNTINSKYRINYIIKVIYFDKILKMNKEFLQNYKLSLYNQMIKQFSKMKIPIYLIYHIDKQFKSLKIISQNLVLVKKIVGELNLNIDQIKSNSDLKFIEHTTSWQLNVILNQIDSVDEKLFHNVTKKLRISDNIRNYVRNNQKINISQAYMKCLEILTDANIIGDTEYIKTFHICEAPGQFVLAFSHYCRLMNIHYDWKAQSLNYKNSYVRQKYPGVLADTYGLIKKFPTRWTWGVDDTGDISSIENIKFYSKERIYDIITSDCGVLNEEYDKQEEIMIPIIYGQYITAISSLKIGGTFFFKTFLPTISKPTLIIIQMLFIHFTEIIYFKPSLNPSSFEYYIIAIDMKTEYTELELNLLYSILRNNFKNQDEIYNYDIYEDFLSVHMYNINQLLVNLSTAINTIMKYCYEESNGNPLTPNIYEKKIIRFTDKWIKKYYNLKKK